VFVVCRSSGLGCLDVSQRAQPFVHPPGR
jgi:hypothetical protein